MCGTPEGLPEGAHSYNVRIIASCESARGTLSCGSPVLRHLLRPVKLLSEASKGAHPCSDKTSFFD